MCASVRTCVPACVCMCVCVCVCGEDMICCVDYAVVLPGGPSGSLCCDR